MFPHLDTVAEYRRLEYEFLLTEASRSHRVDVPTTRTRWSSRGVGRRLCVMLERLRINRVGLIRPSTEAVPG